MLIWIIHPFNFNRLVKEYLNVKVLTRWSIKYHYKNAIPPPSSEKIPPLLAPPLQKTEMETLPFITSIGFYGENILSLREIYKGIFFKNPLQSV